MEEFEGALEIALAFMEEAANMSAGVGKDMAWRAAEIWLAEASLAFEGARGEGS